LTQSAAVAAMIRRVRPSRCGHAARNFRLNNNSDGVLMRTEHTEDGLHL
jgi:hypothetical protein